MRWKWRKPWLMLFFSEAFWCRELLISFSHQLFAHIPGLTLDKDIQRNKKRLVSSEILLQTVMIQLLFCVTDFTWALCQCSLSTEVVQDALILSYHSLASDNLTFLCCFACLIPLSVFLFFFPCWICICLSSSSAFSPLSGSSPAACVCLWNGDWYQFYNKGTTFWIQSVFELFQGEIEREMFCCRLRC